MYHSAARIPYPEKARCPGTVNRTGYTPECQARAYGEHRVVIALGSIGDLLQHRTHAVPALGDPAQRVFIHLAAIVLLMVGYLVATIREGRQGRGIPRHHTLIALLALLSITLHYFAPRAPFAEVTLLLAYCTLLLRARRQGVSLPIHQTAIVLLGGLSAVFSFLIAQASDAPQILTLVSNILLGAAILLIMVKALQPR